jgi:hypothetical protein
MASVFPLLGFWKCRNQELLYNWRFTSNQFILAPSPLRPTTSILIFPPNTWGHNPCVISSLTREWISRLQLLLALASTVILGSESRGTDEHILLSQIRDSPNLEVHVPYLYSPRIGWPSYTPRHWVPFSSPPTTRRATVEVFVPASTPGKIVLMLTFTKICPVPWKHLERSNVMLIALTDIFLLKVKYERSTTNDEVSGRGKYTE